MRILFYITIASLLFLSCSKTIDTKSETELLLKIDKEFSDYSVKNGAAEAFKKYLLEDALQLPSGQMPIRGSDKIYELMKQQDSDYTLVWEPQEGDVAASGDFGYTWGTYTVTVKDDEGNTIERYGKYLNVWKKDKDGNWKVLVDMGNQSPDKTL